MSCSAHVTTRITTRISRSASVVAALLVAGALGGACGGGSGNEGKVVTATTAAGGGAAKVVVGAHDVYFDVKQINAPAGDLTVDLVERGSQSHTFVIEGVEGFKLEVAGGARNASGTTSLDAGSYTYFCDVPGHRGQGMHGTIVVS